MENNDLEKNQSSLDFENEELSIFNQEKPVSKIISDFKPAEIKENAIVSSRRSSKKSSSITISEIGKIISEINSKSNEDWRT